jgi:hypothetical protein
MKKSRPKHLAAAEFIFLQDRYPELDDSAGCLGLCNQANRSPVTALRWNFY